MKDGKLGLNGGNIMISYRKQWFGNILRMQAIIVLVFLLICTVTPFEVAAGYIDETNTAALRTVDEAMTESLAYARQTIRFLAGNAQLAGNLNEYMNESLPTDARNAALMDVRWSLLSTGYSYPEFEVIACVTPDSILGSRGVSVINDKLSGSNRTLNEIRAHSAFKDYLKLSGYSDTTPRCILLEPIGDRAYLMAMLEYETIASTVDPGLFARDLDGNMILAYGSRPLTQYMSQHEEEMFESERFGLRRYGYGLFSNLHLIDGTPYLRSEYSALENGIRYIRMQELSEVLNSLYRATFLCTALCTLGEALMAFVLWKLTGNVLRPFSRLKESAAHMDQGEESVDRINRLMGELRRKRTIQRQVLAVYALTLVPVALMLPVSVNLLGNAVSDEARSTYVDSVLQTADMIANRMTFYQRQNTAMAVDNTLHRLIIGAESRSRRENDAMLESLFNTYGLHMRGVSGGALFNAGGEIIAGTLGYDDNQRLSDAVIRQLEPKYVFSALQTESYGEDGTVMVYAIRSTKAGEGFHLFETMAYLVLETEPLMNFDVYQDAERYYYLYSDTAWSFVETPEYLPFRPLLEGMAQSGLLDVSREVNSHMIAVSSEMLRWEPYMPDFTSGAADKMLVVSARIGNTDLTLVSATSMLPITEVGRLIPMLLGFAMLVFACVMLLVAAFFTQNLVRRVRLVERYFESVHLNHYELPEEIEVNNEIGALAQSMRDSIDRINNLKQAVLEEQANKSRLEVRRREAEVIALQSQMDSHLISNVFATMKLLLHEGELGVLANVIDATGNFLRSGLTHNEYDVTLDRELRHVKAYLSIQSIRFGDKLHVQWEDFDPNLMRCRVPKYLLQPVLENAIKHGMRPKEQLTISIHIACVKGDLSIRVSNNGYGLSPDAVDQLNRRLEKREMADHIGLSNVQERIALRYGPPYGLALSSGEAGLTWVDILLPADMNKENDHVQIVDR